jgi:hypothetical protein
VVDFDLPPWTDELYGCSHAALCIRAAKWLQRTVKCHAVMVDTKTSHGGEEPDAIGWRWNGVSVLAECKRSRGDFRADLQKPHRVKPECGMGNWRWYLTPPGLLRPDEIPCPWGLLECHKKNIRVRKEAVFVPVPNLHAERMLLIHHGRNERVVWGSEEPGEYAI